MSSSCIEAAIVGSGHLERVAERVRFLKHFAMTCACLRAFMPTKICWTLLS